MEQDCYDYLTWFRPGFHFLERRRASLGRGFVALLVADMRAALDDTSRSSSMVEKRNSRLRQYFFLRRHWGNVYLGWLQYFLNHRMFRRSRRTERVGKSSQQLLSRQAHPNWLQFLETGQGVRRLGERV